MFIPEESRPAAPQTSAGQIKADFNNASVDEVFKWLRSQGIDFVVETTEIANRKVTMNVTAKSKDALLKAIADALGFSVEKKDDLYVLKSASRFGGCLDAHGDGEGYKIFGDGKIFSDKERAELEKSLGESFKIFGDDKIWENGKSRELTKEEKAKLEKEMKEWGKNFQFKFEKELAPQFEKSFREGMKMFGDGKIWENGKSRELTKDEKAKLEKEMAELGKNFKFEFGKDFAPMIEKELRDAFKDGKVWENGKSREMTKEEKAKFEKEMKEFREKMKDLPKFDGKVHLFGDGKMLAPHVSLGGASLKELKASLTQAQKELMKKQGHLKPSDLTEAQRKMLGLDKMDGTFTISMTDDEMTITIKGE